MKKSFLLWWKVLCGSMVGVLKGLLGIKRTIGVSCTRIVQLGQPRVCGESARASVSY